MASSDQDKLSSLTGSLGGSLNNVTQSSVQARFIWRNLPFLARFCDSLFTEKDLFYSNVMYEECVCIGMPSIGIITKSGLDYDLK